MKCQKWTKPRASKINGWYLSIGRLLVNQTPVQMLESLISSKEQRRGWRIKMAKMGAASMSDAWTMRLSGIKLFRSVIACIVLQGLFWS